MMFLKKKGMTIPELLVAMFMMLIVISAAYSFYIFFINNAARERIKADVQKKVESTFSVLADDVRHSGFDLLKTPPSGKSICLFSIDDNCSVGDETFCKTDSDRFFVADGWQIIRDFTNDNCPDGNISDTVYESIVNKEYAATITNYLPPNMLFVNIFNIDSQCRNSTTMCGDGSCDDIKDNKAIIICGCKNLSSDYGQEGKRIGSLDNSINKITFMSKEAPLVYNNCSAGGKVVPANVWYIKKASDGIYWLYRNQQKVMPNVVNFQVEAGYDSNGDGIIESSECLNKLPDNADINRLKFFRFKIGVEYKWKSKTYKTYFTSDVEAFH